MSELETRHPSPAAPEYSSADAKTAELAPIADYDGGELEPGEVYETGAELDPDATDAELLAIPPRADDLGAALAARPPRMKLPRITTALVASVLVCAGFIGGVLVQKHLGGNTGNRAGFSFPTAGRTGAAGAGGFFGRGGTGTGTGGTGTTAGGGAITGKVTVVSGDKLYVTAPDGSVYTVSTTGSTTVNVTSAGSLSQLKPGESVVISGSNDGNGNVTADSITAGTATAAPSSTGN
jgi:preprotein translocase subunit SecG